MKKREKSKYWLKKNRYLILFSAIIFVLSLLIIFFGHIFPNLGDGIRFVLIFIPFVIIYINNRREKEGEHYALWCAFNDILNLLYFLKGRKERNKSLKAYQIYNSPEYEKYKSKIDKSLKNLRSYDKKTLVKLGCHDIDPNNEWMWILSYRITFRGIKAIRVGKESREVQIKEVIQNFRKKIEKILF